MEYYATINDMSANAELLPVSEVELRDALRERLVGMLGQQALIMEELGIENGAARIDMAVIDDSLSGYEIKSDFDNSHRLYNQIHSYNRVFEHIYIVTGSQSGEEIEPFLPSWWGIMRAKRDSEGVVTLWELRASTYNSGVDPYSLLSFLKREEINQLGMQYELPTKIIKGGKFALTEKLAETLPIDSIRASVLEFLKNRAEPSSVAH